MYDKDKEIKLLHQTVFELNQRFDTLIGDAKHAEKQEKIDNYKAVIDKQASEIRLLKNELNAKETLVSLKESFEEGIRDMETRSLSKRKEEKIKEQKFIDETHEEKRSKRDQEHAKKESSSE